METVLAVELPVLFAVLYAWAHHLSRIANAILLEMEELDGRPPDGDLDGFRHGARHHAENAGRQGDGDADPGEAQALR